MDAELQALGRRLIGTWSTASRHPMLPGEVIAGTAAFEWLEGEQFLIHRFHYDHPDFPDALSVIGDTDGPHQHYFDTRGVFRLFDLTVTTTGWVVEMGLQPDGGFAQSLTYELDGDTLNCRGELSYDGTTWQDDIVITYRRKDD